MDYFEKFLNKALRFLSFRPRSEKEIRDNLHKKKTPLEIIERIVKSLKDNKFLNDEEFAKWFIDQRLRFRPKSLRIIKLELKSKGIGKETIEQTFDNLQLTFDSLDLDSAKKLVERKIDKYKGMPKQIVYQKLGAFLARRGFDWETIKKSIDDALSNKV